MASLSFSRTARSLRRPTASVMISSRICTRSAPGRLEHSLLPLMLLDVIVFVGLLPLGERIAG